MKANNKMNYTVKDKTINVVLSEDVYSVNDIFLAQSFLSDKCVMDVNQNNQNIEIELNVKNNDVDVEALVKDFYFYLSEQKVRNVLLEENGKIRDLIVEQAFKPIANLKDRVDEL